MIAQDELVDKIRKTLQDAVDAAIPPLVETLAAHGAAGPLSWAALEAAIQAGLAPVGRALLRTGATLERPSPHRGARPAAPRAAGSACARARW